MGGLERQINRESGMLYNRLDNSNYWLGIAALPLVSWTFTGTMNLTTSFLRAL